MKKYIFTETQIKKIVNDIIQEQPLTHVENYEGVIKIVNGKTMVEVTGEMTGKKKMLPIVLRVKVPNNTRVYVEMDGNKPIVYGTDPAVTNGGIIRLN